MARRRKNPSSERDEPRAPLTNVGALNDAIIRAFRGLLEVDRQIEARIERDIKPLREARAQTVKTLKEDTTIDATDIALVYKLWRRQEDAKVANDDDLRDKVHDNLRTLYKALQSGQMLDFIDVLEKTEGEDIDDRPAFLKRLDSDRSDSAAEEDAEIYAATKH